MSHERIISLYERHARAWDEVRQALTGEERPHFDALVADLSPGASILDLGCGSGVPVARFLIERGLAVTGVDSSGALIALCSERFPAAKWIAADMRALSLGRRFDAVLAWHSFFHLSPNDQRAMFPVFARHAAPGALLVFTSGDEEGVAIGEWQGEPLYHASLSQQEYRELLTDNGFEVLGFTGGGPSVWRARFRG